MIFFCYLLLHCLSFLNWLGFYCKLSCNDFQLIYETGNNILFLENLEAKLRSFLDDLHSQITKRVGTKDQALLNRFLKDPDTHQLYMDNYSKCSTVERKRIDAIHGLVSDTRVELDGFMAQFNDSWFVIKNLAEDYLKEKINGGTKQRQRVLALDSEEEDSDGVNISEIYGNPVFSPYLQTEIDNNVDDTSSSSNMSKSSDPPSTSSNNDNGKVSGVEDNSDTQLNSPPFKKSRFVPLKSPRKELLEYVR